MSIFSRARRLSVSLGLALFLGSTASMAVTLKVATVSPAGSVWMKQLQSAASQVSERTEGRVKFKFYPGGVMGDDKAVLRKMRVGQLHGAVLTVGILAQNYPDLQLYGMPLLFRNDEELDYVRKRMDPGLLAGLEEKGFVSFGIAEIGFAYVMSQAPVVNVDQIRAQKVWTPDGDLGSARALQAFRINPIPLTIADVLGGLQTGLIDTIAAPPVGAITLQWHTRVNNVVDLPLLYTYGLLTVAERQFKKISAADQAVLREVMAATVDKVNARSRADHEQAIAVLKQQGLQWQTPDADELAQWQALADAANERLVAEGFVSQQAWDQLQGYLAEVR